MFLRVGTLQIAGEFDMRAAVRPQAEEISKREKSIEVVIVPRYFLGGRSLLLKAALTGVFLIWHCSPAPAQTVNWNGTTNDWFTGTNWSTGTVPSPADDVSIDTSIFPPPIISAPGATAHSLDIGGQFDGNTGIATTGTGFLTIANGGQLANGAGNFFDTFIGVGTRFDRWRDAHGQRLQLDEHGRGPRGYLGGDRIAEP